MIKVKTAREIINEYDFSVLEDLIPIISEAMKEYAKQFIDLAAEEAETMTTETMWQGMSESVKITIAWPIVLVTVSVATLPTVTGMPLRRLS